jgi:FixJ family two-component response regulator
MYELYHLVLNADSAEKQTLLFNIAVVDDDTMFREAMKDYLLSMKLSNVEAFASGEEFLKVMKDDDTWLVVCADEWVAGAR